MNQKLPHTRKLWLLLIVAAVLFSTGAFLDYQQKEQSLNYQERWKKANRVFTEMETEIKTKIDSLCEELKVISHNDKAFFLSLPIIGKTGEQFYYIYKGNELKYWSDNRIVPESKNVANFNSEDIHFVKNGWFYFVKKNAGQYTVAAFWLIKDQYAYENKYLLNHFNPSLGLTENASLSIADTIQFPVTNQAGKFLFSINFNVSADTQKGSISAWLYLCSFVFAFVFILNMLVILARIRSNYGFLIVAGLIFLRWAMIDLKSPTSLYSLEFFNPKYYATSYMLNSLGDLFLNTVVFALFIVYIYIYVGGVVLVHHSKVRRYTWSGIVIGILLFTFLFSVIINYLLSGLIINSQISFNISNVFELTAYSIIGIFIIGILLFCFYLVCDGAVRYIQKTHFDLGHVSILFLITQGIFLVLLIWLRNTEVFINYGVSAFLLANTLILFTSYIRKTSRRVFSFTRSLLVVLGFSVYAAQIIYEFNSIKEKDRRVLLAGILENEHDHVAEYMYEQSAIQIANDSAVNRFLSLTAQEHLANPYLINDISKRLSGLYFSGYFSKYDVRFKYFDAQETPINSAGDPSWNLESILNKAYTKGNSTTSPRFYFLNQENGRVSYSGIIKVGTQKSVGTVIVEMNARLIKEQSGLPELLFSNEMTRGNDLVNYSYARYEKDILVSQGGAFNYFINVNKYKSYYEDQATPLFQNFDNFSHLFYKTETGGLIILSYYNLGIIVYITLFSYIFIFFSILYVIIYFLIRWANNNFRLLESFKSRIQFTVMSIVVALLLLVGAATVTYIINNYTEEQNIRIRQKLNDTVVLAENELLERGTLPATLSDELLYALTGLSTTLSLDFNIYAIDGRLLFTSQPKLYNQELIAPFMNKASFWQLTSNLRGIFIQGEKVGAFSYIAAYSPIRDNNNKISGYISLPYYERETELNKEISSFLVALINIYVFLFCIAVFITFVISNRITYPLRIIQQSLKRTKLGMINEPMAWKRKDEIGALVNEYNRMVEELHRSAEMLTKSERESAWREMAKQVAHEIKNPLTPMKLSVQHLQRAWDDKHPQLEQMVERISKTLIEQIETLSSIATAFSDFAKLPKPQNTEVDLALILENTVNLYAENEKVNVIFEKENEGPLVVFADKDQLIRIFSNLVKNGIQSVPAEKYGKVVVTVEKFIDHYVIAIQDNGIGIEVEQRERIFVPNFTTKTGGTGLGLAMVKNMVEGMNGEVWFETETGKGTTFFVRLPSIQH